MSDLTLFDLSDTATVVPEPVVMLSADRRRTIRQTDTLARGMHPLGGRLHPEAAPYDDRTASGRRCGNCWFRTLIYTNGNRQWPKCMVDIRNPTDLEPRPVSLRVTAGAATDCRSWWPGCSHHTYGDRRVSADAARSVPSGGGA